MSVHLLAFAAQAGENGPESKGIWLEALACLAAISGVTSRVKLVASVIILPQRKVLEMMKTFGTINVLSQRRLVLGVGSGWNAREMAALGYAFATRSQRMDEMLQVMRSVQRITVPRFSGVQIDVPDGVLMAPPAWPGHTVPLYTGGTGVSKPSVRRTLAYRDGRMPYSPASRYDAEALRRSLHQLHVERANQGKPRLDTFFKLSEAGHADPALERDAMELASHGFDEVIIQGIWDAGLEPGIAALPPVRAALDG